jgi:hypothetical protein
MVLVKGNVKTFGVLGTEPVVSERIFNTHTNTQQLTSEKPRSCAGKGT